MSALPLGCVGKLEWQTRAVAAQSQSVAKRARQRLADQAPLKPHFLIVQHIKPGSWTKLHDVFCAEPRDAEKDRNI